MKISEFSFTNIRDLHSGFCWLRFFPWLFTFSFCAINLDESIESNLVPSKVFFPLI